MGKLLINYTNIASIGKKLVYFLGEDVTELAFCYIFYPNRKFMLEGIEIESYQKMQYRKKPNRGIFKNMLNKYSLVSLLE